MEVRERVLEESLIYACSFSWQTYKGLYWLCNSYMHKLFRDLDPELLHTDINIITDTNCHCGALYKKSQIGMHKLFLNFLETCNFYEQQR